MRRKFACKFPVRVNSGHPLFIGDGRTGESPILHTNKKDHVQWSFFIDKAIWDLNKGKGYVFSNTYPFL